eukprot:scaffold8637_cov153-Skeletonema_dohrnii-CCMP3373.AAC.1
MAKPQKKDRKASRQAALATLKSRRSGLTSSNEPAASALDSYNAEVEDVYDDIYDEEEYRRRVESERLKEDFVVDDGEFS